MADFETQILVLPITRRYKQMMPILYHITITFQVLLFTDAEIAEIYRLLAAILHIGKLEETCKLLKYFVFGVNSKSVFRMYKKFTDP